jgi:hypothetical protein
MKRILLAPLFAAASALASPYDQPYSIITTDIARSADPLLIPVIVNRVDDRNADYGNKAVVAPGAHKVTIDVPPRKGFKLATQNTFDLETKPCVRYYVAAKLDTLVTQGWTPVVRSEEPIGECERKFKIAAGAK